MRYMSFNQYFIVYSIKIFSSSPLMPMDVQFTTSNGGGFHGNGFLHMGSLEGFLGSIEKILVTRITKNLNTKFPNNQGMAYFLNI